MELNNNQKGKIISAEIEKPGFYTTDSRKVIDFLIGFFGIIISYFLIASAFTMPFISLMNVFTAGNPVITPVLMWLIPTVIVISLIIYFFKTGRSYIAIGIISATLAPMLFFGACLLMLGSG